MTTISAQTGAETGERVLVVGGNGFIGSHIVDALLASGRQVRVLAPRQESFRAPNPQVEYHFGRLEIGAHLQDAVDGCDAVVDAVSSAVPASASRSPASTIATAIGASAWLAELCSSSPTVRTLVYLSSGGTVYGTAAQERPHLESDPFAPIGAYGALKAGSELAVSGLLSGSSVRAISLRVSNAYGERQDPSRPQGIVAVAFDRLVTGQPLTLFGNTVRDFVHAADVATAVVCALGSEVAGPINVGAGIGVTIAELLQKIEAVAGARFVIDRQEARAFDVAYAVVDTTKAREIGWAPTVDLESGLRRTWDWFGAHAQQAHPRIEAH